MHPAPRSHRIPGWLRLEGTTGNHLVQAPSSSRAPQSLLLRIVSRWLLDISNEGDSRPSLGILFSAWSLHNKILPHIQVEFSVFHSVPTASCPVVQHHQEEPGPSLIPSFRHLKPFKPRYFSASPHRALTCPMSEDANSCSVYIVPRMMPSHS